MKTLLKERNYAAGYVVKTELVDGAEYGCDDFETKSAFTHEGDYIGDPRMAYRICKTRGIKPEPIDETHNICSIGFCEKEQKWYGWSHRAMFGFGVGSEIKQGDCAYVPVDEEDFRLDCIRFWSEPAHEAVEGFYASEDGVKGVRVNWAYAFDVPNVSIRGKISGVFSPFPDDFGRGEWGAKILEDARQMAVDFASGVS